MSAREGQESQTISFGLCAIPWLRQGTDWHSRAVWHRLPRSCPLFPAGGGGGGSRAHLAFRCLPGRASEYTSTLSSGGGTSGNPRGSRRAGSIIKSSDQNFPESVLPWQGVPWVSSGAGPCRPGGGMGRRGLLGRGRGGQLDSGAATPGSSHFSPIPFRHCTPENRFAL